MTIGRYPWAAAIAPTFMAQSYAFSEPVVSYTTCLRFVFGTSYACIISLSSFELLL